MTFILIVFAEMHAPIGCRFPTPQANPVILLVDESVRDMVLMQMAE